MEEIIAKYLNYWVDKGLNYLPTEIEKEMLGPSNSSQDDWKMWMPIPSIVTDSDIYSFEESIGFKYPREYKKFLKFKHFYDLIIGECSFCAHPINSWRKELSDFIYNGYPKECIIEKGKIPFANWSDWGLLCFDTTLVDENDYPIVLWDHEYQDEFEFKYSNFETMLFELDKETAKNN
ncbi:MAG: SMI1/KNR4 family protein [Allomuricauda sp.]